MSVKNTAKAQAKAISLRMKGKISPESFYHRTCILVAQANMQAEKTLPHITYPH